MKYKVQWCCRWSPTLGELEDTHEKIWGTKKYTELDKYNPTLFFGIYSLNDFYVLWRHQGKRCILWAGGDIPRLLDGYWLAEDGSIKVDPVPLAQWINKNCENFVENKVEHDALKKFGIESQIIPSFLGDVNAFPLSFKPGNRVYASVSGDNFKLYGWDKINELAKANPELEFHLYGNTKVWVPGADNITVHGRVTKERMNAEIGDMQCGLRMTEFDGFSEILAKSILMGQWPVSLIEYPHILKPNQLSEIVLKTEPNIEGREYYRKNLNLFPWNDKLYGSN